MSTLAIISLVAVLAGLGVLMWSRVRGERQVSPAVGGALIGLGVGTALVALTPGSSSFEGAMFGALFALFGLLVARWVWRRLGEHPRSVLVSIDDSLGSDGTVTAPVPARGDGVVEVLVDGRLLVLGARAETPLEPGTPVRVTQVLSARVVGVVPTGPPVTELTVVPPPEST